jgi:hypothetical protein
MLPSKLRPFALVGAVIAILGAIMYAGLYQIARAGDDRQTAIEQIVITSAFKHLREKLSNDCTERILGHRLRPHRVSDRIENGQMSIWGDIRLKRRVFQ